ncbi:MAG: isoprenylcysteine carboxylmethyltransferase family protein [Candidatus Neomarinimicrobiota bacterium]|nr:MAG: isoprenylcysteine carboxylmethyltransferase family protein [Candidatus Neomarinimicrobiota bacterium]
MDIRDFFFRYRSYTPIPLALIILYYARPSWPLTLIGFLVILLGESIRFQGVRYAGGVTRTTKVGAPSLCTAGPFARLRNPLYLGNMVMYTGVVLFAGAPNLGAMLLLTWAFFLIQYSLIVSLEEETLVRLFGEEYETYRKHVPALIPRWTPWESPDQRQPQSFRKTLRTEKRTLQNVALILLLIGVRSLL